jgi:hypothetical protein
MPSRLKRFHASGQAHFVTFSCYHRMALLHLDPAKQTFEAALERVRGTFHLYIYGYVVMPEHIHLLVSEPERETLAVALKSLKQGRCPTADRRTGTLLAEALLRFQHPQPPPVCREAQVYPQKSGEARSVRCS